MKSAFFIPLFLCVSIFQSQCYEVHELKCQVCARLTEEINKNITKVDQKKIINVGSFRLDDKGNYIEKAIPYARSEIYLTELMENICDKMDDYVRATSKTDGRLTVIQLISEDGKMNPIMGDLDIIQDSDLNKSLKYYCEDIIHEHDEAFVSEFREEQANIIAKICVESTQLCADESLLEIPTPPPPIEEVKISPSVPKEEL